MIEEKKTLFTFSDPTLKPLIACNEVFTNRKCIYHDELNLTCTSMGGKIRKVYNFHVTWHCPNVTLGSVPAVRKWDFGINPNVMYSP